MKEFSFSILQQCIAGPGSLNRLPEVLKACGSDRIFLISDRMLESLGLVGQVEAVVRAAGIRFDAYLDVLPNPTVEIVKEAAAAYRKSGATALLALGGGSPMDVAKAVGVVAKFGGDIGDYEGVNKVPGLIDPLIAIPTTAGTGSEVTVAAVITDEARNYKLSVLSQNISARYAILDPRLIQTAPASVAAACGVDAMIHALEAYINTAATPFSDAMAEKALELIGGNLRRYVANRADEEAACAMMIGSTFAGVAFAWARLGNIHAMSHPISAFYHVAHGVANAVLMPTILAYNALADQGRYAKIYRFITGRETPADFVPMDLVTEIRKLNRDLGIPENLAALGVEADKIPQMAADAMQSGNVLVNPRATTQKDIERLYHEALTARY